jgi:N-acetylmuramoyl-L-alanine amidase
VKTQAALTLTRSQLGKVHRGKRWSARVSLPGAFVLGFVYLSFLTVWTAPDAFARTRHGDAWARQEFAKAERMREALNGRAVGERTRHEYQRVIDAYRRVYLGSPSSSKADPSVVATAELLVEMGRRFNDDKILRGAVDEYRFLRKEYPGSKYRFDALFTIGEIYKDDLNDPEEARKTFEDFLHRYPRNRLAEDARGAIHDLDDAGRVARSPHKGRAADVGREMAKEATPVQTGGAANGVASNAAPDAGSGLQTASTGRRNELPRVTGVRHWSTPDYTRVAIDVEQDVKFNSSRISDPDRIFFDLRDTRLASTLVGKTFDVDDGFLKKIRVAEFKPGQTRIVLEVDNLSRYDAFLLPDPYRLIIDIHGRHSRAAMLARQAPSSPSASGTAPPSKWSGTEASATSEAADDFTDMTPEHKVQVKSEKEHAIVATADEGSDADEAERRSESIKEELAKEQSEEQGGDAAPTDSSGVVKTTVVVKGTNRRIPKTIVAADDDDDSQICSDTTSAAKSARGKGSANALKRCATPTQDSPTQKQSFAQRRSSGTGDGAQDQVSVTQGQNSLARSKNRATQSQSGLARNQNAVAQDQEDIAQNRIAAVPNRKTSKQSQHGNVSSKSDGGNDDAVEEAKLTKPDDGANDAPGSSLSSTHSSLSPSANTKTSSRRKKLRTSSSASAADTEEVETREARPTAMGDRSLTRALGLKIGKIVIDPGHGGHDTGTIGPNGLEEKDLVLDVSKRLGRLLEARLGAEVIYTRRDDTFIPLETRTAIANRAQADLFISVHANSSHDEDARGVETYYLNFTSSPEALEVAARENAVSEKSVHELQDLVKKIALKEKIDESREFASDVQDSLYGGLGLSNAGVRNRGVKKAPFIVLIGANMPSILAEISFVSNPTDERKLETPEQRQRIAESLYRGVARYASGLSGVKVASKIEKTEGQ